MRHLVRSTLVVALAIAGLLVLSMPSSTVAKKFPEPSPYPVSWELTFKHSKPKRIVVDVPGHSTPSAYWYMTYTVTNNTNIDRYFTPMFDLVTENGKIYPDDNKIPLAVVAAVRKIENNPHLQTTDGFLRDGKLLQGEDQAKDGVAIWEEPSASMREFTIFVGGLSGEFVIMKDDDGKIMKDPDGSPIILHKTLELSYQIHGPAAEADQDQIQPKPEKWVMR